MAYENPGEIDLIAIGPLTNLAAAVKIDPQVEVSTLVHLSRWPGCRNHKKTKSKLPSKLKSLTIMGGNINGVGNMHVVGTSQG